MLPDHHCCQCAHNTDIPIRFQTLVQRMHVLSVGLHYFLISPNIIWLPWQRPLTNRKTTAPPVIQRTHSTDAGNQTVGRVL